MTIELCTNYCAEHEFNFAGLQFRYASEALSALTFAEASEKLIRESSVCACRSECYCGNQLPKRSKSARSDDDMDIANCCAWTCAGQLNETCGGNLCSSVYAVNITPRKELGEYPRGSAMHSEIFSIDT